MSGVTDADRERAAQLMNAWDVDDGASYLDLTLAIAAALAEEREKARAPFLAVMARCNECRANAASVDRPAVAMAYDDAAEWIRRAAEDDA